MTNPTSSTTATDRTGQTESASSRPAPLVVSWIDEDGAELLGVASELDDAKRIAEDSDLSQDVTPLRWKRVDRDYMAEHPDPGYGYWKIAAP